MDSTTSTSSATVPPAPPAATGERDRRHPGHHHAPDGFTAETVAQPVKVTTSCCARLRPLHPLLQVRRGQRGSHVIISALGTVLTQGTRPPGVTGPPAYAGVMDLSLPGALFVEQTSVLGPMILVVATP